MPYIRDSYFKGREFTSLAQMQDAALAWCTDVYGLHNHRGLDGAQPAAVFDAIERRSLTALPPKPFELVLYQVGKVAPDCHVKAGKALYSVPWRLIGQQVAGPHLRRRGADLPHRAGGRHACAAPVGAVDRTPSTTRRTRSRYTLQTVVWCRAQAEQIGPGAVAVVAELSQVNALHRLRAIQGTPAAGPLRRRPPGRGLRPRPRGR